MMLLQRITYPVLDVLFPCECAVCGAVVSYSSHGICGTCRESIIPPADPCPVCAGRMSGHSCGVCRGRAVYLTGTIALGEYTGVLKRMIASLKFNNNTRIARYFSGMAAEKLRCLENRVDFITAVPMSRKKKWKRGFNQSELIARKISRRLGIPFRRLLEEKKGSGSQKILSITERFINTIGRYRVTARDLEGRSILIVDDVFTTGSTINECSRVLREAGCTSVYALVLARVASNQ